MLREEEEKRDRQGGREGRRKEERGNAFREMRRHYIQEIKIGNL